LHPVGSKRDGSCDGRQARACAQCLIGIVHFYFSTRFSSWKAFRANFACTKKIAAQQQQQQNHNNQKPAATNKQTGFPSADRQLRLKAKGKRAAEKEPRNLQIKQLFLLWLRVFYANCWRRGTRTL